MMTKADYALRQKFDQRLNPPVKGWQGVLGDGAGAVAVPGQDEWRYVRPLGSDLPIVVRRGAAPDIEGLRVYVGPGYGEDAELRILGAISIDALSTGTTIHADTHYEDGPDPVRITDNQIMPLLVVPTGGLAVRINGGLLVMSGKVVRVKTQNYNFASDLPTDAGAARWSLVRVDENGDIDIQAGDDVASYSDLQFSDAPTCSVDYAPIAMVRLYTGQTALSTLVTNPDVRMLVWGGDLSVSSQGGCPGGP
jgi:hypothetical protein